MNKFTHLHCHSTYSLLDGLSRIPQLVEHVKASGMDAIAVTDHGNMVGAIELISKCKEAGIKPIVGIEAYIAPTSRLLRQTAGCSGKEHSFHITLLAKNSTGFNNLIRLSSLAFLEGFYYKPRIDKEILERHSDGVICLSGCASSELSDLLLNDKTEEAEKLVAWYQKVFGDRFFCEIQDNGVEIQRLCLEPTVDLANRMGVPLVASSDAHFIKPEDHVAHDALLCINTHKFISDTNRMKFDSDQFHVRTPDEMHSAMPGHAEAIRRSKEISDSVEENYESFGMGRRFFPVFTPPRGKTVDQYLRELCQQGIQERYENPTQEHWDRLDHELDIVSRMGFSGYFLLVWDFVRYARENGIPCSARGSAAGAIISYSLYLSHVCPIKYGLLFERFLDFSRSEPPDIDIDICQERRCEVVAYLREKHGEDRVANIGTIGTMAAKGVIRDVARVLGMPAWRGDEIAKLVPHGLHSTIGETREVDAVAKMISSDGEVKRLFELAEKIEGTAKSAGTHAAGIVIADRPLIELAPLQKTFSKTKGKEAVVSTQWTMGDIEKRGLLKVDALGLRNLTSMASCIRRIRDRHGITIDLNKIPKDDPVVYKTLKDGNTKGVFQLESSGITDVVVRVSPDSIEDLTAIVSLYRPGPLEGGVVDNYIERKHGRQEVEPVHPIYDKLLKSTYNYMIYQEDIMRLMNVLAGIPLNRAYACIKAISKKKEKEIEKNHEDFVAGCVRNGVEESAAQGMFDKIKFFSGYGFNKAHACAYANVGYQTAWLKTHYPREFMASILSSEMGGAERENFFVGHIEDTRRMGIEVLPPDINRSSHDFSIEGDSLRYGLLAIKGLGEGVAKELVAGRSRGPYSSLTQMYERCPSLNAGGVEALIRSGTLDGLGYRRAQWLASLKTCAKEGQKIARDARSGQSSMFELLDETPSVQLPDVPELPDQEILAGERETLGIYVSNHPLNLYADLLDSLGSHVLADIQDLPAKSEVIVGGMIAGVRLTDTKKQDGPTRMAILTLEDKVGTGAAIVWPDTYVRIGKKIQKDAVAFFRGKVDRRRDPAQLIIDDIIPIDECYSISKGILCQVSDSDLIPRIEPLVKDGVLDFYLEVLGESPRTVYRFRDRIAVDQVANVAKIAKIRVMGTRGGSGTRPLVKRYPDDFNRGTNR